jgi:hypothetical protein
MPTTNTNGSPNGPRDSLSDYEFSFETYLDYKSRIEIDVSLRQNDGAVASWMLTFLIVKSLDHMRYIVRIAISPYFLS